MDKDGNYILKPLSQEDIELRKSSVFFDHYVYPTGTAQQLLRLRCSVSRCSTELSTSTRKGG